MSASEQDILLTQIINGNSIDKDLASKYADRLFDKKNTPLIVAIMFKNKQAFDTLLPISNVNIKGNYGYTALHVAVMNSMTGITSKLLEAGADKHITNNTGMTPFMLAAKLGFVHVGKLVAPDTADDLAKQNVHGETALVLAMAHRHVAMSRYIVDMMRRYLLKISASESKLMQKVMSPSRVDYIRSASNDSSTSSQNISTNPSSSSDLSSARVAMPEDTDFYYPPLKDVDVRHPSNFEPSHVADIAIPYLLKTRRLQCKLSTLQVIETTGEFQIDDIEKFVDHVVACIRTKSDAVAVAQVEVVVQEMGHSNLFIVNNHLRTVYRYEPHGVFTGETPWPKNTDAQLNSIFATLVSKINKRLRVSPKDKYKFIQINSWCPYVKKGWQDLEGRVHRIHEEFGFCQLWSIYFADAILGNPSKSISEIYAKLHEVIEPNAYEIIRRYLEHLRGTLKNKRRNMESYYTKNVRTLKRRRTQRKSHD